ncbi:MAG: hypothetical protein ACO1RX_04750 [Candidatus Sericytochromatia bacterium]
MIKSQQKILQFIVRLSIFFICMNYLSACPMPGGPKAYYRQEMTTAYWSPDSKKVAFIYTNYFESRKSYDSHLVVYDLEAQKYQITQVQQGGLNFYGWTNNHAVLVGQDFTDGRHYDEFSLEGSRTTLFIRPIDARGVARAVPLPGTKYVLLAENNTESEVSFRLVNSETEEDLPITLNFSNKSLSERCGVSSVEQTNYSPIETIYIKKINENWFVYFSNRKEGELHHDGIRCDFYGKFNIENHSLSEIYLFNEEEILEYHKYRLFMGWLPNHDFVYGYDEYRFDRQVYEQFNFAEQKQRRIELPSVGMLSPDGRTILYQWIPSRLDFFDVDSGEKQSSPEFFEVLPKGELQYVS